MSIREAGYPLQYVWVKEFMRNGYGSSRIMTFGAGLRGFTDLANVKATIGGINAPIFFVGPTGGFVGLDQANLLIDRSLIGRGTVDVTLTVDGKTANTVTITIK